MINRGGVLNQYRYRCMTASSINAQILNAEMASLLQSVADTFQRVGFVMRPMARRFCLSQMPAPDMKLGAGMFWVCSNTRSMLGQEPEGIGQDPHPERAVR